MTVSEKESGEREPKPEGGNSAASAGNNERRRGNRLLPAMAGLGSRIDEVAEAVGGKKELSRRTTIHETQLYRYIGEDSVPSASALVSLSREGGVNLEWLSTGEGEKWRDESNPAYQHHQPSSAAMAAEESVPYQSDTLAGSTDLEDVTDTEILAGVMEGLDRIIEAEGRPMDYRLKAELTVVLYDYYRDREGEEITPDETGRVVRIFNHLRKKRGVDDGPGSKRGDRDKAV